MKILVIDDEPLVRYTLKRVFETQGDSVLLAENGRVGLELWESERPDLVFIDVIMPQLTGPEVLTEIGEKKSGKVIMMSAFTGEHSLETAKQLGADDFIEKPFDDIFAVLERAKRVLCES